MAALPPNWMWRDSVANSLRNSLALSSFAWQENAVRSLQALASPAWRILFIARFISFKHRKKLTIMSWRHGGKLYHLRFHPDNATIARDATGLNPVILAGGAAMLAGLVYKHFTRPDGS